MFEKTLNLVKRALNFNFTGLGPRNITKRLAVGKSLLWLEFLNVKNEKHISAFLYSPQLLYYSTSSVRKTHLKLSSAKTGNLNVHLNVKVNRIQGLTLEADEF